MHTQSGGALAALSDDIAATVERVAASVVAIQGRDRLGSTGFYIAPHTVVTADHALEREDVRIVAAGGTVQRATILARDPSTDIALLRSEVAGPAPLPAAYDTAVGAIALAVARDDDGDIAATMGVVGSAGAAWRTWRGGEVDSFIRPDLALSPRFSGSPLVDARGRLVGLNTWGLSRRQSLTVPAATVARIADALVTRGRVARGYLGIAMQALQLPDRFGGGSGVIVLGVAPEGPADAGGVIVGDIVTSLGGRRISESDDVQAALDAASVGAATTVTLLRGGTPRDLQITIGERPHRDDADD
ncbi:MAG: S1C family serine protease [Candidatus Velthaea sp.]